MSDDHLVKSSQSKVLATVSLSTNYSAVQIFVQSQSASQLWIQSVSKSVSQSVSQ